MRVYDAALLPQADEASLRTTFGFPALETTAVRAYEAAEIAKVPYDRYAPLFRRHRAGFEFFGHAFSMLVGVYATGHLLFGAAGGGIRSVIMGTAYLVLAAAWSAAIYWFFWRKKFRFPAAWREVTWETYLTLPDAATMPTNVRAFGDALHRSLGKRGAVYVNILEQQGQILDPILRVADYSRGLPEEGTWGPIWKDGGIVQI